MVSWLWKCWLRNRRNSNSNEDSAQRLERLSELGSRRPFQDLETVATTEGADWEAFEEVLQICAQREEAEQASSAYRQVADAPVSNRAKNVGSVA